MRYLGVLTFVILVSGAPPGSVAVAEETPRTGGHRPNDRFFSVVGGYNAFTKPDGFCQSMSQFGLEWGGHHQLSRILFGSAANDYVYFKFGFGFMASVPLAKNGRVFFEPNIMIDIWTGYYAGKEPRGNIGHIGLSPGARLRVDVTPAFALFGDAGLDVFPINFGDDTVRGRGMGLAFTANGGFQYRYD